ncbi:hypothetical protein [Paraburkholderia bryophila]|uniref:hypothetical protein n=1 Tax=Paraburkholderia bryophila TaxID=420952 RepID=UPI0015948F3B|nr:hypothetical protein [Paraburkholderia bryophila]
MRVVANAIERSEGNWRPNLANRRNTISNADSNANSSDVRGKYEQRLPFFGRDIAQDNGNVDASDNSVIVARQMDTRLKPWGVKAG